MTTLPPLGADELAAAGTEREVLETLLDWQRLMVIRKAAGLADEAARRRLVPSATTLAGVVLHLAGVERWWFLRVLGQRPGIPFPGDESWQLPGDAPVSWLIREYEMACEQSRQVAVSFPLGYPVPHDRLGRVNLRWIYAHMIRETARHAGHMDILRELADGSTGVDG